MTFDEEVLQDRADRPVVRRGNTVRHPMHPWTPATHALLDYLHRAGFPYSPRPLGMHGQTEILSYIDGASGAAGWSRVVNEAGLRAVARMLRLYHDIVREWRPTQPPVWFTGQSGVGAPGEVVCHGDIGPWNMVWRGSELVGLLDWEYAHPAPPGQDAAYALAYLAPCRDDETCLRWLRYPEPPDRKRRIEIFAEAYGLASTHGLVDAIVAVQRLDLRRVRDLAEQGHRRQVEMVADGELERLRAHVDWTERHRDLLE